MSNMNSKDKQLMRIFNYAKKKIPEHVADTTPIGAGLFGLVVAHEDNTLTKILFKWGRKKDEKDIRTFGAVPVN